MRKIFDFLFSNKNSNLDEHQEQVLLKIEHNGCWFAFWALFIAMAVESLIYGMGEVRIMAGEWIIFMCLALYLTIACIKNGIWDRKIKANTSTNLICSLVAGGFVVIFQFFVIYKRYNDHFAGALGAGVFTGIFTFILTFAILELCTKLYKKKREQLEQEDETE